MRKFFLFVVPAVLCTVASQAKSALWSTAFSAVAFDSTHQQNKVSLIAPEKVCEAAEIRLQPSTFDSANTYLWKTPSGKEINGVELVIDKAAKTDAGNYVLKIVSADGHEETLTAQVKIQSLPTASVDFQYSVCQSSVFGVSAKSSPAASLKWILPNASVINNGILNIEKVKLTDAGTYSLKITEAGCENVLSYTLQVRALPDVTIEGAKTVCEGTKLVLKAQADSAVKYTWWKGQNALQSNPVFKIEKAGFNHAGKYLLQAKANGCVNSTFFNIDVRPTFKTGISGDSLLCAGETLSLKAVEAGDDAMYDWSGPSFSSSKKDAVISNVQQVNSGVYAVTVTKNGCSLSTTMNVKVNPRASAKIIGASTVCDKSSLKLSVEKEGNYTWTLPSGEKRTGSVLQLNNMSTAFQGVYKVISDGGRCADSSGVEVRVVNVMQPKISGNAQVCEGSELTLTGMNANENSKWIIPNEKSIAGTTLSLHPMMLNGGVVRLINESQGCFAEDSIVLKIKSVPQVNINGTREVCRFAPSFNLEAKELKGQHGRGLFSGDIISAGGLVSTNREGLYTVQYTFTADNGCSSVIKETIRIKKGIEVQAGADITRKDDEPVHINAIASDSYSKIEWTNVNSSDANSLHVSVKPEVTTTYKVTVTNNVGCSASDEVTVKVLKIKLANAFSPNGDGINDQFTFEGLREYPNAQIQIFNALGKQVFAGKGPEAKWDGRANGIPVEGGTYYYNITLNKPGFSAPVQGWIQLKR